MANSINYWSISSKVLTEEAELLGLRVEILIPEKNFFYIHSATKSVLFKSTDFGVNTALGTKIADNKELTYCLLKRLGMPIPKTLYVEEGSITEEKHLLVEDFRYPVIIKPTDGAHGRGVQMSIRNKTELYEKLVAALAIYPRMIVQEEIPGEECRMLVVGGKVLLAVQRIPPEVVGDGRSRIGELIDIENTTNPLRAKGYEASLSTIEKDDELIGYISKAGYSFETVLARGTVLRLRGNSNLGTGGTARDVTEIMHEDTKKMCIEVAEKFGLGICGVDILSTDFSKPLRETGGVILEMNHTPGLGGDRELTNVNTGREILKYLFEL